MQRSSNNHQTGRAFPATRYSAVFALKGESGTERTRALNTVVAAYWRPVYTYLRLRWNKDSESAKDLTQAFFTTAIDKDYLASYDAAKGRFRTFLRTCLDRFVQNLDKAESRQKRGGNIEFVPIDFGDVDGCLELESQRSQETPEERFEKEWVRALFTMSVDLLRRQCENEGKLIQFKVFKRFDLDRVESDEKITYKELADELGIDILTVNNYLSSTRRLFRAVVLESLANLTSSDQEFCEEARIVLGINIDS